MEGAWVASLSACFLHEYYCFGAPVSSSVKLIMSVLCRGVLGLYDHSAWHLGGAHKEVSPGDRWGQERDSGGKSQSVLLRHTWHPVGASETISKRVKVEFNRVGLMVGWIQAGER